MIFGRRGVTVQPGYTETARFEFGAVNPVWKLTVACTDDVVLEVSESYPPIFAGTMDTEVELDKGTHSISFVNEVHGIRFRAVNSICSVSLRCYGPGQTN